MKAEQKDLRLQFTAFELEGSVNCNADYVVMWDGKDKSAPLIGNKMLNRLTKKFSSLILTFFV